MGVNILKKEKFDSPDLDLGDIFQELESYENFFPLYKTMIKK